MQTFLPAPSFEESASALDRQRLGKQRVETKQLLMALTGADIHNPTKFPLGMFKSTSRWRNHPCARMWIGHELALCEYGMAICAEWRERGYTDNLLPWFRLLYQRLFSESNLPITPPDWFGHARFHAAHRAALLKKNPDWYEQFGWDETPEINYWWPK